MNVRQGIIIVIHAPTVPTLKVILVALIHTVYKEMGVTVTVV